MHRQSLIAHPAFAPGRAEKVTVRWGLVRDGRVMLRFRIDGAQDLVIPPPKQPARADDLWTTTCCELFLARADGSYHEFNFSPSGEWAAYAFSGYRSRIGDLQPVSAPEIAIDRGASVFTLTAFLDAGELEGMSRASLTAVLEEKRARPSYWAVRHGGLKPDFHNPACFVLPVP